MTQLMLGYLLLLTCFTAPIGCQGAGGAVDALDAYLTASTSAELEQAVTRIHGSQTVRLNAPVFELTQTLVLDASNVSFDGGPDSATLRCPPNAGALLIRGSNVTLRRLQFHDCKGRGAVVVVAPSDEKKGESTIKFQSLNFVKNQNVGKGAAVQLKPGVADHPQTAIFETCVFDGNWADDGAAIHAEGFNVVIKNSEFANNTADSGEGGAVRAIESKLFIEKSRFFGNEAARGGGAVAISDPDGELDIVNSVFEQNSCRTPSLKDLPATSISLEEISTGGAISIADIALFAVRTSTFQNNTAVFGGAIDANRKVNMGHMAHMWNSIENCTFRGNEAHLFETISGSGSGGAVALRASESFLFVNISNSDFLENYATRGGALGLGTLSSQIRVQALDESNRFSKNRGLVGGAVCLFGGVALRSAEATFDNNHGDHGGAISLMDGAQLDIIRKQSTRNLFINNTAANGGAVACQSCGHVQLDAPVLFSGNVAREFGGAIYIFNFQGQLTLPLSEFVNNVAAVGGAVNIYDQYISEIGNTSGQIRFTNNLALTGGALYVKSQHALTTDFQMMNVLFEHNEAIQFSTEETGTDSPVLKRWRQEWKKALADDSSELEKPESLEGRGGALYLSLEDIRTRATVLLQLTNVTVRYNSAVIGGGAYIATARSNWHREIGYWPCRLSVYSERVKRCYDVGYNNVVIANNTAKLAAGGLFLSTPKSLSFVKVTGILSPEAKTNQESEFADGLVLVTNNSVEDQIHGYGPQVATDAVSLTLMNVEGPLTNFTFGKTLGVGQGRNSSGILIEVRDKLNQTISGGTADACLVVYLASSRISGERRYVAQNGIININETTVVGVNITSKLTIYAANQRNISVSLEFSTLPCSDGELADEFQSSCFRCKHGSYTFGTKGECRNCEKNALCPGTTALVPKNGYWHSSPFSPKIRHCLVKKVCSWEDRKSKLLEYYNNSAVILQLLHDFGQNPVTYKNLGDDYPQCAPGHEGILCGSCSKGYGHSANGQCQECDRPLAVTRLLTVGIILTLFIVVSFRLFLEVDGVRKDVAFELAQQRREFMELIQANSQADNPARKERGGKEGLSLDSTSDEVREGSPPATAQSTDAAESSSTPTSQDHRIPLLLRSRPIEDPLASGQLGDNEEHVMPSPEVREASGILSETYKILFNYVQLNSVALSLDAGWRGALKGLLSVQSSVGRITNGMQFLPFDCNFSDRSNDVGIPNSINALLFQTSFPFMTIGAYAFLIKINQYFQRESAVSRYEVAFLPPLRLVFLVVYLSYCIDIFSNLLKVMNCFSLDPLDSDYHYSVYETMEPSRLWAEDTAVTCWKGAHLWASVVAAFGLAFCLGVICFTVVILYQGKRQMKLATPEFLLRYGFLYLGFRSEGLALYWESVITIRRMLMASLSVYTRGRETTNAQIGFAAMVIFTYIALHMIVQPYDQKDSKCTFPTYAGGSLRYFGAHGLARQWVSFNQYLTLNSIEGASLFMSLSLFMTAMGINDEESVADEANVLLGICCVLNCIFFLFMIYRLWCGLHHSFDIAAKQRSITFQGKTGDDDNCTWLLYKIWVIMTAKSVPRETGDLSVEPV